MNKTPASAIIGAATALACSLLASQVHAQACASQTLATGGVIGGYTGSYTNTLTWNAVAPPANCQIQTIVATGNLETAFSGMPDTATFYLGGTPFTQSSTTPVGSGGPTPVFSSFFQVLSNSATSWTYAVNVSVLFNGDGAYIDPTITADFSSMPQTSPYPEPATWVMLMLGVAGLGLALRRARATLRTA